MRVNPHSLCSVNRVLRSLYLERVHKYTVMRLTQVIASSFSCLFVLYSFFLGRLCTDTMFGAMFPGLGIICLGIVTGLPEIPLFYIKFKTFVF